MTEGKAIKTPILEINNLSVSFDTEDGVVHAVRDVSFEIPRNKTVALLGESGCGKSVTGLSILRLVDPPGRIAGGEILFRAGKHSWENEPVDLLKLAAEGEEIRSIRGNKIAMIFQEPMSSLTPVFTIGNQISEAIRLHQGLDKVKAKMLAVDLLSEVGIPAPDRRYDEYPHQLSGGMCQRAMIAMALSCNPALLIADEPTTALDVTIQAQVLDVLRSTQELFGMSILFITHDMGVVAEIADEVVVMYLGKVVESGPVKELFDNPKHPYTQGLFASVPRPESDPSRPLERIAGSVPDHRHVPEGCPFRGRCPEEMHICKYSPTLMPLSEQTHKVSCWIYQDEETLDPSLLEKEKA
ncbi:ABC transporter ATP-binding protein [bacterium]|nr:ABC transporter ATP-binding protein [bacterium]